MFFIFALECADGSHYTSISSNVLSRLEATQAGNGPISTRDKLPVTLAFTVGPFPDHQSAAIALQSVTPDDRFSALLRGDDGPVQRFGVTLSLGEGALQAVALESDERGRPKRPDVSVGWTVPAGVTVDSALSDPQQLASLVLDFCGPRDGDIVLRRLVTDQSLAAIGALHGRKGERVRQIMAKFGRRLRGAFHRSEVGTRLLDECRVLAATSGGKLSPLACAPLLQRLLGWMPDRVSIALLTALVAECDPRIELTKKLLIDPAAVERRRLQVPPVVEPDEVAFELIQQLGAGRGGSDDR